MSGMNDSIPCNPLTNEHCDLLNNVLQGCALQADLLARCQQAGLTGIDGFVKDNNRRAQLAQGLKQAFFPDRP